MRRVYGLVLVPGMGFIIAACGGAASSPSEVASGTTIGVTLQEWAVVPETTSTAAGPVTFRVTNTGPEDVHEFVILRTETESGALPTDENGAVSEEGEGLEVVDEIEDVAVGANADVTVDLAAGHYVLLCNIYSADEQEAHYQMGMRTDFTVSG